MPKRPSPFEGEGQEGEVCHPQPVMLSVVKHPHWIPRYARNDIACHAERSMSAVKHPHWIPRYARNDITCHAERSEASTHWIHLALAKHCLQ